MNAASAGPAREGRLASRTGLSLVELLVVMVVAGIVVGATYQVLTTNQRVHTTQQERAQAQETLRASMDVLSYELRGASTVEEDLLTMEEDQLEVRVPQAFGLFCEPPSHPSDDEREGLVRVMTGEFRDDDDQAAFLFASDEEGDSGWHEGQIQTAETAALPDHCTPEDPDAEGQSLWVVGGAIGAITSEDREILAGYPVWAFKTFEYTVEECDGASYLTRRDVSGGSGGDCETRRLVGPVRPQDGVRFEYLQADGTETTDPSEVARIRVTVHAERPGGGGQLVTDSLTVTIQPRD